MRGMNAARLVVAAILLISLPARAEVSDLTAAGFLSTHRFEIAAAPGAVYEALSRAGEWWNGQHTYSGNAANLALEARAGGCFCERWDGNSIEHGRVIYAQRDKALRIDGALGPRQEMGAVGVLQFALAPAEAGTKLVVTYRVRLTDPAVEKIAPVVDRVIGEQARRLAAFAAAK
jgi:hypothetical protein